MAESATIEIEAQGGAGLQTAKDLFSGAVGGIAQVLIGSFPTSILRISSPLNKYPQRKTTTKLTPHRPTLRHRQSPPPNLNRLPLRPGRRNFHLQERRPPRLLQRHPHAPPRHRCLRIDPIRRLPLRPAIPRATPRRRQRRHIRPRRA